MFSTILTLLDIRYFLVNLTWGGLKQPPPGKHTSGTFMSSNDLVTHQAPKNGQYYDLKQSKILFNPVSRGSKTGFNISIGEKSSEK